MRIDRCSTTPAAINTLAAGLSNASKVLTNSNCRAFRGDPHLLATDRDVCKCPRNGVNDKQLGHAGYASRCRSRELAGTATTHE